MYSSEILSLRYIKTRNGYYRNVFIKGSILSIVITYYKGYSTTRNIKIIYRYLLKEVSKLLIYYL